MITFAADIRSARAVTDDAITTSSVGIPVTLNLASDFDGLAKTLVFANGSTSADVVLAGDATEATVPVDVLQATGWLTMGVYAADGDGNIVIPTVWATVGHVVPGTVPSGVDPSDPQPNWAAQVQTVATEALENSEAAIATATIYGNIVPSRITPVSKAVTSASASGAITVSGLRFTIIGKPNGGNIDLLSEPLYLSPGNYKLVAEILKNDTERPSGQTGRIGYVAIRKGASAYSPICNILPGGGALKYEGVFTVTSNEDAYHIRIAELVADDMTGTVEGFAYIDLA